MSEAPSPKVPPSIVPQKRGIDDDHTPAISSPLNPEPNSNKSKLAKEKVPIHREPREKKESLKKREAKSGNAAAPLSSSAAATDSKGTPDRGAANNAKEDLSAQSSPSIHAPLRYKLPPPKDTDYAVPRPPVLTPSQLKTTTDTAQVQFYESSEHVYNRKGFRYTHCIADPTFASSFYYRQSETEPFTPRINYEDTSSHILFDKSSTQITTEKGFRMARANVGAREGRWYWECRITSGIRRPDSDTAPDQSSPTSGGHVRMGWARREATLDAPVGLDAYSYGLRDVSGQKMHMSRPQDFFPAGVDIVEGDVIGLEISLPSLALHRKVVEGHYNPAVDVSDTSAAEGLPAPDIIRDRVPIRYKAHLYFEQFEYAPTKELEDLTNPTNPHASSTTTAESSSGAAAATSTTTNAASTSQTPKPSPTHPQPALRTLPGSSITIYKNGERIGVPFTDLLAFLPPASKPLAQVGARDGLDDGMLAYFPALSVFRGGAAEANFGPKFRYPPPELQDVPMKDVDASVSKENDSRHEPETGLHRLRPLCERYDEQIAEDVLYDIIDEVDFWLQDGGDRGAASSTTGERIVGHDGDDDDEGNDGDGGDDVRSAIVGVVGGVSDADATSTSTAISSRPVDGVSSDVIGFEANTVGLRGEGGDGNGDVQHEQHTGEIKEVVQED
ncbi:MAG: hypothetical protein M1825_000762 [Sarcosagium campestre]|nr:MAG: hypothetical protein M1825_000762 [Sarcosagium campestre]